MSPDNPTLPNEESNERPVFAESSLPPLAPPTSGSETLVPTPETEEPTVFSEIVIAPELASELAPEPPNEPELAPEPQLPAEPVQPAENPALALMFAPAPDAPFQSSVTVGISSHVAGAQIFYTLDGTAPDETSTPYPPEKILLTESVTLSARAVAAGDTGPICSADYIVSKPLWQKHDPADKTDETPHEFSDNLTVPDNWQSSAASVRGKLHAHRALWREDAFALGFAENAAGSWSICIVSDGAGSAPLSRVGSNVACQVALGDLMATLGDIETLSDNINADLPRIKAALVGAAGAALKAIRDEATARNQPINAFAATLLILVRRAVGEAQLCAALQVGDGAIALDCESGLKLLGTADHGQHSSETRFLTTGGMETDFANRVKFSLPTDLRATLVVSDGVSDDYFPEDKRLTEVFQAAMPLAQNAEDAGAALLEWLGYEKKGSSDDRTIVLSWPARNSAIDALEAELSEAGAGVSPSSNLQASSETRLEEGAIPALAQGVVSSATSATASASPTVADDVATAPANGDDAPDVAASNATETRDGF